MKNKTVLLAILDGWGYGEPSETNAVTSLLCTTQEIPR